MIMKIAYTETFGVQQRHYLEGNIYFSNYNTINIIKALNIRNLAFK